jgi:hypothetical protein
MYIEKFEIWIKELSFDKDGVLNGITEHVCDECWWWQEWFCGHTPLSVFTEQGDYKEKDYTRESSHPKESACGKFIPYEEVFKYLKENYKDKK